MIKSEALRPLRPHRSRKLRFEDIDKDVELAEVDEVVKAVEVVELMVTDRLQSTF